MLKEKSIGENSREVELEKARKGAEGLFQEKIKPGMDRYFPKLEEFTQEVCDAIKRTGKTAVFLGRDGRWLFYIAKLMAPQNGINLNKIKFIDISLGYLSRRQGDLKGRDYIDYFNKLSVDLRQSFLVDVGFRGTIIRDIRDATKISGSEDIMLVGYEKENKSLAKGYFKSKIPGYGGDQNSKMGLFIEDLPHVIEPVEQLKHVPGGKVPDYHPKKDLNKNSSP